MFKPGDPGQSVKQDAACLILFRDELRALSERLREFIESMPQTLRSAAKKACWEISSSGDEFVWPTIYFLLPFWLQSDIGKPIDRFCRQIGYANACLAYVVLVQDRVADALDREEDRCSEMMVANAFLLEGMQGYRDACDTGTFNDRSRELLTLSWEGLAFERSLQKELNSHNLEAYDLAQGSKINVGKIAALAILQRAGREGLVAGIFRHLELWQKACQMMDDAADYGEDLARGHRTTFTVLACRTVGQGECGKEQVERAVGSGAMRPYFVEVRSCLAEALGNCPAVDGYLGEHIGLMIDAIERFRVDHDALLRLSGHGSP